MSSLKRFQPCFINALIVLIVMLPFNFVTHEPGWFVSAFSDAMFVLLGGMIGTFFRILGVKENDTRIVPKLLIASSILVILVCMYVLIDIKGLALENTLSYTIRSTALFTLNFYFRLTNIVQKL